jgi:5-amino-6-(5-phosphoribosylamino)uracil reductase/diaminohydroxyphosphoribosylaminopyrimidine deaminase/5-amino-6-(5-phosphoribosylamino)uracil reductase
VKDLAFVRRRETWSCEPTAGGMPEGDEVLPASLSGHGASDRRCADRATGSSIGSMARVYLPVLFQAARARAENRVFVVAHVTQTLDGRIACENGQSQWIGNDADLRHTHRMRALVDAVMIGAGTALTDDPRLTVRLVAGPSPRRVVLSGSGRVLQDPRPLHVFAKPGCDVIVGSDVGAPRVADSVALVRVQRRGGALSPHDVLAALYDRGIRSIYLEGGSSILSSFLQASTIDLLQVHIASMVLGSGLPSFRLPAVDHVDRGLRFGVDHAMLDGHVLLSCWPRRGADR